MPDTILEGPVSTTATTLIAISSHTTEKKAVSTGLSLTPYEFKLGEGEKSLLEKLHQQCFNENRLSPTSRPESGSLESLEMKTNACPAPNVSDCFLRQGPALAKTLTGFLQQLDTLEAPGSFDKTASSHKLLLNQYRSAIIKVFADHLQVHLRNKHPTLPKAPLSVWKYGLRYLSYGFLLVVGMIMDGIGSFLGGQELIHLLPGISGPLGMVLGILFSLINSALFYSFEATMLKQMVGLNSMDEIGKKLEMDQKQIKHAEKINELLLKEGSDQLDVETYEAYTALAEQINTTIVNKTHLRDKELPETTSKKIFRHAVTLIGALMVCGYGYFMVNSLLLFMAPALIGTPLGWTLIGVGIFTMLAYYLSMRGKAMATMLNPASQKFKETRKQYTQFEKSSKPEFKKTYDAKQKVKDLEEECALHKARLDDCKHEEQSFKTQLASLQATVESLKKQNAELQRMIPTPGPSSPPSPGDTERGHSTPSSTSDVIPSEVISSTPLLKTSGLSSTMTNH